MEINGEMSMDAKLIGKFITQQVAVAMAKKTKHYEKKIKNLIKAEEIECRESYPQKTVRGAVDAPYRKTKIQDSNDHQVWSSSEICVSIGTRPKEYPPKPFARKIPKIRRCQQR